jgi:hypothetical protein
MIEDTIHVSHPGDDGRARLSGMTDKSNTFPPGCPRGCLLQRRASCCLPVGCAKAAAERFGLWRRQCCCERGEPAGIASRRLCLWSLVRALPEAEAAAVQPRGARLCSRDVCCQVHVPYTFRHQYTSRQTKDTWRNEGGCPARRALRWFPLCGCRRPRHEHAVALLQHTPAARAPGGDGMGAVRQRREAYGSAAVAAVS